LIGILFFDFELLPTFLGSFFGLRQMFMCNDATCQNV
jgi:hypothetical protein